MIVPNPGDALDRDLMRRVSSGDQEAFRELFDRYGAVAHGLARRILRQAFMAEEAVQEAFLGLWRNPDGYRHDRGSVRAWLLSSVHHRAVDAVRREEAERRKSQGAETAVEIEEDIAAAVVDEAAAAQARTAVRSRLAEIPQEQRRVLEMMYFDAKTQSQIAQELGIPLGTVKSRTLLGMRRLKQMLGEVSG